jgi:polyphosphate kinase 2 (PPK2 family)
MKIDITDFRVREGDRVDLKKWPTEIKSIYNSSKHYKKHLAEHIDKLTELQRLHYASRQCAILLIFQAMDAAGKDGAIRHVMSGGQSAGLRGIQFQATERHRTAARLSVANEP